MSLELTGYLAWFPAFGGALQVLDEGREENKPLLTRLSVGIRADLVHTLVFQAVCLWALGYPCASVLLLAVLPVLMHPKLA